MCAQEDLKVLEEGRYEFGSNERNCIVVLKGEKEVCHNYIQLEEIAIPLLEMQVSFSGQRCMILHQCWCSVERLQENHQQEVQGAK